MAATIWSGKGCFSFLIIIHHIDVHHSTVTDFLFSLPYTLLLSNA